jgi:hypothetical protein
LKVIALALEPPLWKLWRMTMFDALDKAMARGYHHFATPMQKIDTIKRMEMGA